MVEHRVTQEYDGGVCACLFVGGGGGGGGGGRVLISIHVLVVLSEASLNFKPKLPLK